MSDDHIDVNLFCPECKVAPKVEDKNDDASAVYCPQCDAQFGTYGEVKAKALNAAKGHAQDMLRNAFKGKKGWKLTRRP